MAQTASLNAKLQLSLIGYPRLSKLLPKEQFKIHLDDLPALQIPIKGLVNLNVEQTSEGH